MKYNISINQLVLSKTNLDIIDCAIIDYLYFYCNSNNEKIEKQRIKNENGVWTWIDYQTLLRDMPLLKIKSSGALSPRIRKIKENGYIDYCRMGNQKLFIKLNSKIDELFIEMNSKTTKLFTKTNRSCSPKRTNNNTIYNNTNDNISIEKIDFSLEEKELTRLLYSLVKENYSFLKDKTEKQLQDDYSEMNKLHRIDGFSYEQVKWIIKWSQQDEFWKQNIRSVSKLRKQFSSLIIKAKGDYDKNNKSKTVFI